MSFIIFLTCNNHGCSGDHRSKDNGSKRHARDGEWRPIDVGIAPVLLSSPAQHHTNLDTRGLTIDDGR